MTLGPGGLGNVDDFECRFCASKCSLPNHFRTPDAAGENHVLESGAGVYTNMEWGWKGEMRSPRPTGRG